MTIYHLNISRGDRRSVVAATTYRADEVLPNEAEEKLLDFGGWRDVIPRGTRLRLEHPNGWPIARPLWNTVAPAEKRHDTRPAKEIKFALPRELPRIALLTVTHAMADAYTGQGVEADFAIHDDGCQHKPHVYILLTTRVITPEGFGPKFATPMDGNLSTTFAGRGSGLSTWP